MTARGSVPSTKRRRFLRVPMDQMKEALREKVTTEVTLELLFSAGDVRAARLWAEKRKYNYDDLGDLLSQWALSGSPGSGGPDVNESWYGFYE